MASKKPIDFAFITVGQARKILLKKRLIFGDPDQIRLLEMDSLAAELEAAKDDSPIECGLCGGKGEIDDCDCPDCSGHRCPECNGTGKVERDPRTKDQIAAMTIGTLRTALMVEGVNDASGGKEN